MFSRYADPLSLLDTYRMSEVTGFILQLYDEVSEKDLWEYWLHKDTGKSYKDFKRANHKPLFKGNQPKALTPEQEQTIIEENAKYIKPTNRGGET